jgi:hypothetical protein
VKEQDNAEWWATAPTNSDAGWDVSDDPSHGLWVASDEKLFMTAYAMSQG